MGDQCKACYNFEAGTWKPNQCKNCFRPKDKHSAAALQGADAGLTRHAQAHKDPGYDNIRSYRPAKYTHRPSCTRKPQDEHKAAMAVPADPADAFPLRAEPAKSHLKASARQSAPSLSHEETLSQHPFNIVQYKRRTDKSDRASFVPGPSGNARKSVLPAANVGESGCNNFTPNTWKPNRCRNCLRPQESHTRSNFSTIQEELQAVNVAHVEKKVTLETAEQPVSGHGPKQPAYNIKKLVKPDAIGEHTWKPNERIRYCLPKEAHTRADFSTVQEDSQAKAETTHYKQSTPETSKQPLSGHQRHLNSHFLDTETSKQPLSANQRRLSSHGLDTETSKQPLYGHQKRLNSHGLDTETSKQPLSGHQRHLNSHCLGTETSKQPLSGHQRHLNSHSLDTETSKQPLSEHQRHLNRHCLDTGTSQQPLSRHNNKGKIWTSEYEQVVQVEPTQSSQLLSGVPFQDVNETMANPSEILCSSQLDSSPSQTAFPVADQKTSLHEEVTQTGLMQHSLSISDDGTTCVISSSHATKHQLKSADHELKGLPLLDNNIMPSPNLSLATADPRHSYDQVSRSAHEVPISTSQLQSSVLVRPPDHVTMDEAKPLHGLESQAEPLHGLESQHAYNNPEQVNQHPGFALPCEGGLVSSSKLHSHDQQSSSSTESLPSISVTDKGQQRQQETVTSETLTKCHNENSSVITEHRVFLCGPGRSGKSSLKRSLLGKKFKQTSKSTIGMKLDCAYAQLRADASGAWQLKHVKSTKDQSKYRTAFAVMKTVKKNLAVRGELFIDVSADQRLTPQTSLPLSAKSARTSFTSNVKTFFLSARKNIQDVGHAIQSAAESSKRSIEQVLKNKDLLKDVGNTEEMCFISLWDLAGQESMSIILQPLMSNMRCIYCVTYDVSLDLDSPANPTFGEQGREYSVGRSNTKKETNLDVIASWLDVLHHAVSKRDSTERIVYLVGCKADKIPHKRRNDYLARVTEKINEHIVGKPYEHDIADYFFVDNTLSGKGREAFSGNKLFRLLRKKEDLSQQQFADLSVFKLQNKLIKLMREHPSAQICVPLRWSAFPDSLEVLFQDIGLPVVPLEVVEDLAIEACGVEDNEELGKLIALYHSLGHLLHYDDNQRLQRKVLIHIQWFVRCMAALFTPAKPRSETDQKMAKDYKLLHDYSILTEELAVHIWKTRLPQEFARHVEQEEQRTFLFALMEEHALLVHMVEYPAPEGEQPSRRFWVPAMAGTEDERHEANESVSVYLHCLNGAQFPRVLFWKLVASCIKLYQDMVKGPERRPNLCRSSAKIWVDESHCLVLRRYHSGLHITMLLPDTDRCDAENSRLTCHTVLGQVEVSLHNLVPNYFDSLRWELSARCTCVPLQTCQKHGRDYACTPGECYHLASLKRSCCPKRRGSTVDLNQAAWRWNASSHRPRSESKRNSKSSEFSDDFSPSARSSEADSLEEKALRKVFICVSRHFNHTHICDELATFLEMRDDFVAEIQHSQPDIRTNYTAIANIVLKCWNKDIATPAGWSVEKRMSNLQNVLEDDLGRPDLATTCSDLWQKYSQSIKCSEDYH